MNRIHSFSKILVLGCFFALSFLHTAHAQTPDAPPKYPDFPSETPANLVPSTRRFRLRKARRHDPHA